MTRNPEFTMQEPDSSQRVVETLVTLVMTLLAVEGWLAYIGR